MGTYASVVIFPDDHRRVPEPTSPMKELGFFRKWFRKPPPPEETKYSVVATLPQSQATTCDLVITARNIVRVFETFGYLPTGISEKLEPSRESTFATCEVTREPPEDLDWITLTIEASSISPSISELVWTFTEGELANGLDREPAGDPDALAHPWLIVSVFSYAIDISDGFDSGDVVGWAFVEFDFADCRYKEEIHRIRDNCHPIFAELEKVFGCKATWGIVAG